MPTNLLAPRNPLARLLLATALLSLAACDRKPSTPPTPSATTARPASAPTATELRPQSSVAPTAAPADSAPKDVDKTQEQGNSSSSPRVVGPTDGHGEPPK